MAGKKRDWRTDQQKNAITDAYDQRGQGLKPLGSLGKLSGILAIKSPVDKLGSIGDGIKFEAVLPDNLLGAVDGVVHLDDPDVQEVLQRIDSQKPEDVAMAKRVVNLKRTQFHNAPYTELITHDWFTQKGVQFAYQVPLNGGRTTRAGQVLDFAVFGGGSVTALAVQGDYWHSKPAVAQSDELDKISGLGQYVNGQRITKYLGVWESRIYKDRDTVLTLAMVGIELPRI